MDNNDIEARLRGQQPLQLGDRLAAANEISRLRTTNKNARDAIQAGIAINVELQAEVERLRTQVAALQARLDALMLEFCPDEMSEQQIEAWARHQRPASDEVQVAFQATRSE